MGYFKQTPISSPKKNPDYSKLLKERRQKKTQDPQKDVVCCSMCKGFYSRGRTKSLTIQNSLRNGSNIYDTDFTERCGLLFLV